MIEQLKQKLGNQVQENISLKQYTTFKIGGPAKFFIEVKNKQDLQKALQAAKDLSLPFFILGGGSNVLINDDGFDGLVIRLTDGEPEIKDNQVIAFAGINWPGLVIKTINTGLTGLEFSANIPGTVGGAVRGNAGAFGQGVGDFIKEVEVLNITDHEISLKIMSHDECNFDYRQSIFKINPNLIITEAIFELKTSEKPAAQVLDEIRQEKQGRCAKQPLQYPSAGCVFVNIPYTDELSQYKDWQINGKIPAARFIDEAGFRGKQIGGAKVSDEHANFIINLGNSTASDVIQLISLIKMKVRDEYGVQLMEEIQYVGFD